MNLVNKILEEVKKIVDPILIQERVELVDIEFKREKKGWVLRFFIDKEGGVNIDDCVNFSHEVSHLLDIEDFIPLPYTLEVSSPGLNRPLKKEKDFLSALGKKIKVKTISPIKGRRNFKGILKDFNDKSLFIEIDNEIFTIPFSSVTKANLLYEF
ncbi:MAG: ribosome maturation factor RimP [Deltaproteobacteria bacterium]|nr:ribosome maturation factor RimP [Deltaproteobacteria bacterium]RLA89226.1 MAG: ribosome maturation factor RimP [Deltaproteobacteria bacterium]